MQDPLREIPPLCKAMLNPDAQLAAGQKYLTDDVQLLHFQVWVKGREGFLAAYHLWSWINQGKATFHTDEIMYSGKNKVTVRGHTSTHIILLPSFRLEFFIELLLTDDPMGKRIHQQHDHLLVLETFVYQLPLVGVVLGKYIPQVSGAILVTGMQLFGSVLNWLGVKSSLGSISAANPYKTVSHGNHWPVPRGPMP